MKLLSIFVLIGILPSCSGPPQPSQVFQRTTVCEVQVAPESFSDLDIEIEAEVSASYHDVYLVSPRCPRAGVRVKFPTDRDADHGITTFEDALFHCCRSGQTLSGIFRGKYKSYAREIREDPNLFLEQGLTNNLELVAISNLRVTGGRRD